MRLCVCDKKQMFDTRNFFPPSRCGCRPPVWFSKLGWGEFALCVYTNLVGGGATRFTLLIFLSSYLIKYAAHREEQIQVEWPAIQSSCTYISSDITGKLLLSGWWPCGQYWWCWCVSGPFQFLLLDGGRTLGGKYFWTGEHLGGGKAFSEMSPRSEGPFDQRVGEKNK